MNNIYAITKNNEEDINRVSNGIEDIKYENEPLNNPNVEIEVEESETREIYKIIEGKKIKKINKENNLYFYKYLSILIFMFAFFCNTWGLWLSFLPGTILCFSFMFFGAILICTSIGFIKQNYQKYLSNLPGLGLEEILSLLVHVYVISLVFFSLDNFISSLTQTIIFFIFFSIFSIGCLFLTLYSKEVKVGGLIGMILMILCSTACAYAFIFFCNFLMFFYDENFFTSIGYNIIAGLIIFLNTHLRIKSDSKEGDTTWHILIMFSQLFFINCGNNGILVDRIKSAVLNLL